MRSFELPIGSNYLRCQNFNLNDGNSLIMNFYQIGPRTYRTQVLIDLLGMITYEPLFNTLRTNEQLAYSVSFHKHSLYRIMGYSIKVHSQENKFSAEFVDERIEHFRQNLLSIIETMSETDFQAIKLSIVKAKLSDDDKLKEEMLRNWYEIENSYYRFDRLEKEVETLATITKDQLLEFYRTYYGDNERKLSVQIIGNGQTNEQNESESKINENIETHRNRFNSLTYVNFIGKPKGNLITDFTQFKKSLRVFPLPESN